MLPSNLNGWILVWLRKVSVDSCQVPHTPFAIMSSASSTRRPAFGSCRGNTIPPQHSSTSVARSQAFTPSSSTITIGLYIQPLKARHLATHSSSFFHRESLLLQYPWWFLRGAGALRPFSNSQPRLARAAGGLSILGCRVAHTLAVFG